MRKFVKGFIFTLYLLLLIEIGFRVLGFIYLQRVKSAQKTSEGKREFIIYCVGDSHIYGIGAPLGMSMPDQLESLLNTYFSTHTYFKVINFGIPGRNSSQVIYKLQKEVEKEVPNLAIVIVGANNLFNIYNSNIINFLPEASPWQKFKLKGRAFLENFRIYKALRYLLRRDDIYKDDLPRSAEVKLSIPEQNLVELFKFDYHQIEKIGKRYGFDVLFMTYPDYNPGYLVFEAIKKALYSGEFKFIDNIPVFKPLMDNFFDLIIYPDRNHPNEIGYRLMAFNIISYLKKNGYLPDPSAEYPDLFDNLEEKVANRPPIEIINKLLLPFENKTPIPEISTPQDFYEKYEVKIKDQQIEFIFKNGEFYSIKYPGEIHNFDLNLLKRKPEANLLEYILGEPDLVEKFDREKFQLFDEKWVYTRKGKRLKTYAGDFYYQDEVVTLTLLLKDKIGIYGFFDDPFPSRFNKNKLEILENKPNLYEIKAVFGEPYKIEKGDNNTTLLFYDDDTFRTKAIYFDVNNDLILSIEEKNGKLADHLIYYDKGQEEK